MYTNAMAITNYGTKFSDEHKQKLSDSWVDNEGRVAAARELRKEHQKQELQSLRHKKLR